jgi:hypothetical protein
MRKLSRLGLACGVSLSLWGCGPQEPQVQVPETYGFTGRNGASSVAYTGQTLRHVLIEDLKAHIGGLTARIEGGTFVPEAGRVKGELDFFYRFDGATSGDVAPKLAPKPAVLQAKYSDLSAGANLTSKIAGNDEPNKQHTNWTSGFRGGTAASPEAQVLAWFQRLDELAVNRANGTIARDPSGAPIAQVYVTPEGQDLRELIQKFLGGAVAFSQGADDYLDEGLASDHSKLVDGRAYTELEHAWDEGFGYFGAQRDFLKHSDETLSATPYVDTNGDAKIDLLTEYSYGHSINASKRDLGSAASAKTDFSGDAMKAFLHGRALIAAAKGPLTEVEKAALEKQRDIAVLAWEKAIAASAVHYINEVLVDMARFGGAEYKFVDHAKHWSELKGFALSLQFNPRSPLTDAQFETLHAKLGDRPVLPNASPTDIAAYKAGLIEARGLLKTAYGFADANMGDSNGLNGW